MFHLGLRQARAGVRSPMRILRQVISSAFRKKNVTGITAVHHPLRNVDARPGNIRAIVHIRDLIHRTAMNPHAQGQVSPILSPSAI